MVRLSLEKGEEGRGRRAAEAEWQENAPLLPLQSEQRRPSVRPSVHHHAVTDRRLTFTLHFCVRVSVCVHGAASCFHSALIFQMCVLFVLFTSSFAACLFLFFFYPSRKTLSVIVRRSGKICRDVYRGVTRNLERRRGGRNGGRKSWDPSQNKSDEKGQRLLRGAGGELAGEGGVESRAGWEFVSVHFHSLKFSFYVYI